MPAIIHHLDLYGRRATKYSTLESLTIHDPEWSDIMPVTPYYFFVPKDLTGDSEYQKGFSVGEIFLVNVAWIITARDGLVIAQTREELIDRMKRFFDPLKTDEQIRNEFFGSKKAGKYLAGDSRGWQLTEARRILWDADHESYIREISYRPFDTRYIYYHPKMVDWGREKIFSHIVWKENIGMMVSNQLADIFTHSFISRAIVNWNFIDSAMRFGSWNFLPLYLYPDTDTLDSSTRTPNIDPTIWQAINALVSETTPEQILDYIYAVLHSPAYREQYQVFLKTDFPRVPYPRDREQFDSLVSLGGELRELHLMISPRVSEYVTTFPVAGSCTVESIEYREGRVSINADQYFGGVPELAWTHPIGGYFPAQKWLKDRKWQVLSWEDIAHYQSMIVALSETARVMGEIEKIKL